ncbi:aminotransferase [Paeniglutamicibacter cryotolerans]|uniref:4-aminobutyrate aminotransferase-like enzyme/Ser/Thr protein kinase RdoA (MazF antagonist) n=1 Tax=Paeniglutamicibacter cryotolerans TaxID=670079 RepID=A0A839QRQ0_9MICC|nr:aminotransferase [Paeniglutamicibacter cryotolerans]MBB2994741.1 4-aminobutyrate aminotransferase-like enzyme/Ser/Thr protein kinase RdoA (MazF antagonist) [Paeniglutamicibacter cryotolerans]
MTTNENTKGFDFFAAGELPAPIVSPDLAERWAEEAFGLSVRAVDLGSQQDANFLLMNMPGASDAQGEDPVAVMKISNSAFDAGTVDDQDRAAQWVADFDRGLRAPSRMGEVAILNSPTGTHIVRLIRYLEGGTLHGSDYLSVAAVAEMGRVSGEVSTALANLPIPPAERILQWDLRQGPRVVEFLAGHIADTELRQRVVRVVRAEADRVERVAALLPVQVIHGDLTDDNLMRSASPDVSRLLDGVIDFGDLMLSWCVAELATTISSILHHDGASALSVLPAVRAFHRIRPLSIHEVEALWPLVVIRGAVLVTSGHQQVGTDEFNDYARDGLVREQLIFDRATSVPSSVMTEIIAQDLDLRSPGSGIDIAASGVLDINGSVAQLDLSVGSRILDDGAWTTDDDARHAVDAAINALFAAGHEAVIAPFGAIDATRSRPLATEPAATWRTGTDVWVSSDVELLAPWSGEITATRSGIILTGDDATLRITADQELAEAPVASSKVTTGTPIGVLRPGARYRLTVTARDFESDVPDVVLPELAAGWMPHLGDPGTLFGLVDAVQGEFVDDNAEIDLLSRRGAVLADVQEHYYALPPRIDRGWKHHLIADDGRVFLDMVNNVTVLGHSHPRVARAIADQWKTFNSNSRFHYASIVALAEKLTALLPESLDTVFLVNSGSEAVELALRLARVHTGREDLLAVRESYHGWTYLADAVSTSAADNPRALASRPEWVHTLDVPNAFRGRYRGEEAHRYADDAAAVVRGLVASGRPPAAFICEPVYGSAGGVTLPAGYLEAVYSEVRRAGGVTIADEVQVGLGRLGSWFWGFQQQDVVPDLVTIAKSFGDGHPLGAVVTTKAIAASYADEGYFFSSTGGSPVSSVVGSTVLDVIAEEDLAGNARRVGTHLKNRLQELAQRHELIGAVHGEGLYLGVEFVRDRITLEPATAETSGICERLLQCGIIVQPTGNLMNVLKIKPPLSFDEAAADFFVDALDRVLA